MRIVPLKENETAKFRLINSGKINPKTNEPMSPAGLSLPGQTTVKDFTTGKSYTIFNTPGDRTEIMANGTIVEKPIIERLRWGKTSVLTFSANDNHVYLYAMAHNANQSNKFRDLSREAKYFLEGDKAVEKKQVVKDDQILDAMLIIRLN